MSRPQFTLKSLLWLMVVVAAFCAGIRSERYLAERRADAIRLQVIGESDFDWQPLPSPARPAAAQD